MGDFSLHKRKNSLYLPRNELHFAFNGKISAYFIFVGYSINDKTFYLISQGRSLAKIDLRPSTNRSFNATFHFKVKKSLNFLKLFCVLFTLLFVLLIRMLFNL